MIVRAKTGSSIEPGYIRFLHLCNPQLTHPLHPLFHPLPSIVRARKPRTDVVQKVCKVRWKVEEFHRELKQLTGIESCQCRKGRIQRNHIACAMLVWLRLKNLAYSRGQTIYQIKHGFLSNPPRSTTQTSGRSHVYRLVVGREAQRSCAIACDSCVSPD